MDAPLDPTRYYTNKSDINYELLLSTISYVQSEVNLVTSPVNRDLSFYVKYPCAHLVFKEGTSADWENDTNYKASRGLFKCGECSVQVDQIFSGKETFKVAAKALRCLQELKAKIDSGEERLDVTDLYFLSLKKNTYTLHCGHHINYTKLSKIVDSIKDVNAVIEIAEDKKLCEHCSDENPWLKRKFAMPNSRVREVAVAIDKLLSALMQAGKISQATETLAPRREPIERVLHDPQTNSPEDLATKHFIAAMNALDYQNPSWDVVLAILSNLSRFSKDSTSWNHAKVFFNRILDSKNYELALMFLNRMKDTVNPIMIELSANMLQRIQTESILIFPESLDDKTGARVSNALSLLRIGLLSKYDVYDVPAWKLAARSIIKNPYIIMYLTQEGWASLPVVTERFPSFIKNFCPKPEQQSERIEHFAKVFEADPRNSGGAIACLDHTTTYYYERLLEYVNIDEIAGSEGFHQHLFSCWLMDNMHGGKFNDWPIELKRKMLHLFMEVSGHPSVLDIKLLQLFPMMKETLYLSTNIDRLPLFYSWLERCIKLARSPDEIPTYLGLLKTLRAYVRHLVAQQDQLKTTMALDLMWLNFLSKSNEPRLITEAGAFAIRIIRTIAENSSTLFGNRSENYFDLLLKISDMVLPLINKSSEQLPRDLYQVMATMFLNPRIAVSDQVKAKAYADWVLKIGSLGSSDIAKQAVQDGLRHGIIKLGFADYERVKHLVEGKP